MLILVCVDHDSCLVLTICIVVLSLLTGVEGLLRVLLRKRCIFNLNSHFLFIQVGRARQGRHEGQFYQSLELFI